MAVILAQSVDNLVDNDSPQNIVKFRLGCDFDTGDDLVSLLANKSIFLYYYICNFLQFHALS